MKRRPVRRMHAADFFPDTIKPETLDAGELANLEAYLQHFVVPQDDGACLRCHRELSVRWKLAHGEAACTWCGYPCRSYHYLKLGSDTEERRYITTLQYHPRLERRLKTVRETLEAEILELKTDMRVLQTRFDAHKVSCRNGDV